ncbi:response regulator [candidate division KSB1 bacterium]
MTKKILIVDDEEDFLKAITIRLNHAGYDTSVAHDGVEAFSAIESDIPDLIILDVQMPKMDGLQFIKQFRKNNKFKGIPIIFLTAGAFDIADEVETLSTAQDFLLKSIDNEQIIDRVTKLL